MLKKRQVIVMVSVAIISFLVGTMCNVNFMALGSDGTDDYGVPFDKIWTAVSELQSRVDSLNASLIELEDRVSALEELLEPPPPPNLTIIWNSFESFRMEYPIGTTINSPYEWEFDFLQTGQYTEITEGNPAQAVHGDGATRFLYIWYTVSGVPSGYLLEVWKGFTYQGSMSSWYPNHWVELDKENDVGKNLLWRFRLTNLSGDPEADFSNFKITFTINDTI